MKRICIRVYVISPQQISTLTVNFQMRFSLSTLCLAGLSVDLSCVSGSTLEITASSSVTAGPYPKLPDVVECAPEYGENLETKACYKALQTMPDGRRFSQFVSRKSYAGQEALITPVYYYDNTSKSFSDPDLGRDIDSLR